MGAGQVVVIVLVGLVAALAAAYLVTGGHLFDGCSIHLESEASRPVSWSVDYKGRAGAASGTLMPGTTSDVKLCTFSPRGGPEGSVRAEGLGNATFRLDPTCGDWRFLVNDTALVPESRACS